ncbi:hypothetical protein [Lichenibacterium dinghuense]|uniref:hypothetical protein n=1 Tax=Lichenibacterium dinghuense TaxID=2895977 RepID=UPI001F1B59E4|nr:hypothetical protein [Lichenibacterium sp. 6Y81]
MHTVQISGASSAPPPILLQADRVRRRISASDSVAALVASLAFGEPRRSDLAALASVTSARVADAMGVRS